MVSNVTLRRNRGLTLIEMLVVMAIGGIVMATAGQSGSAWMTGNRLEVAKANTGSVLARARVAAVRNENAAQGTNIAVNLRYDAANRLLYLCSANNACPTNGTTMWQERIPANVTINIMTDNTVGAAISCLAFTNRGRLAPAAATLDNGSTCQAATQLQFALSGKTTQIPI